MVLRFLLSPVEIRGEGRVESVVLARNALEAGPDGDAARAGHRRAHRDPGRASCSARSATAARRSPTSRSTSSAALIANDGGRACGRGEYVVGWAKRGPSGVIGTNKKDANETVDALLEDLAAGALLEPEPIGDAALEAFIRERQPELVDYEGWVRIDRHEQERGEPHGRPRVKLARLEELLAVHASARR